MNKSLLLVICDFLLLSFLGLANFDNPKSDTPEASTVVAEAPVKENTSMLAILQASLEAEQKDRLDLEDKLVSAQAQASSAKNDAKKLKKQQEEWETQYAQNQEKIKLLEEQQQKTKEDYLKMLQEKSEVQSQLLASQDKVKDKSFDQIDLENQLELQKLKLADALRTVSHLKVESEAMQKQNQTLSSGIATLAETTEEILKNQPISSNSIYDAFKAGLVTAEFVLTERGFFGNRSKSYSAKGVVSVFNGQYYLMLHAEQTPFSFEDPNRALSIATAQVKYNSQVTKIDKIQFLSGHPHLVAIPLSRNEVDAMGVFVFKHTQDPTRFSDAVIIEAQDGSYEDVNLIMDASLALQVKVERLNATKRKEKMRYGAGDILFDRSGKFLGVMVNRNYASLLQELHVAHEISLGKEFNASKLEDILEIQALIHRNSPREIQ